MSFNDMLSKENALRKARQDDQTKEDQPKALNADDEASERKPT